MTLFKLVSGAILAMFVVSVVMIVLFVSGAIWGVKKVNEKGLKNVVESVWNGPTNEVTK